MGSKPKVVVTRKLPEAVEARLRRDYEPLFNSDDHVYSSDELIELAVVPMLGAARRTAQRDRLIRAAQWRDWSPAFTVGTQMTRDAMGFRALDNLDAIFAGREPGDRVA